MRSPFIAAAVAAMLACGGLAGAAAADDTVSLAVPYSPMLPTTIGSGLDFDLVNQSRFSCAPVQEADIVWLDTQGAIETKATVELVTTYSALAKTLNLESDYKSKADVSIAALKGGASVHLNVKYDTFAQDENRSLALVIKAQSDYGRRGLRNRPALDKRYQDLLDSKDYPQFRQLCGTHTVLAEHRTSMVAVVITLSDMSSSARQSLQSMFETSGNFGGTINVATVSANSDMATTWKQLVETASRVGKMRLDFESRGGQGLSDALKLAVTSDPTKIDQVLAKLVEVGSSFTNVNSAVVEYVVLPNTAYGMQSTLVSPEKLAHLNSYYLQLSKVDFALRRLDGYRTELPTMYSQAYVPTTGKLKLQRKNLVTLVENCVVSNSCPYLKPAGLDVLFLEDIIVPESFELVCNYRRFDSTSGNVRTNVLDSAALVLRAQARLSEFVSVSNAIVSRLADSGTGVSNSMFQSIALSSPDALGTVRIKAQLDTIRFNPTAELSSEAINVSNLDEIIAARKRLLGAIYGMEIQAKNGIVIMNSVGPPFGGNCPVQKPVL